MVVLQTIILRQHLGLGQGREHLAIEKLVPQATVERLSSASCPRLSPFRLIRSWRWLAASSSLTPGFAMLNRSGH
jgi:hypothetical protein